MMAYVYREGQSVEATSLAFGRAGLAALIILAATIVVGLVVWGRRQDRPKDRRQPECRSRYGDGDHYWISLPDEAAHCLWCGEYR